MITVQYDLGSSTNISNIDNDLNKSGLFLFLAKLKKKRAAIPNSNYFLIFYLLRAHRCFINIKIIV